MNDWHDMDEELKEVQRLDETHVLDASNFNGLNRGNAGYDDHMMPGADKELQESSVMTFEEDRVGRAPVQRIVDINEGGLHSNSKIVGVAITDFDWKYEK